MIKLRAMIVIVYPSWLSESPSDVLIFRVEDEHLVVCMLLFVSVEFPRSWLLYDVAFVPDHVFWGVNRSDYCLWGLCKLQVGLVAAVLFWWLGVEIFEAFFAWRWFFELFLAEMYSLFHFFKELRVGVIISFVCWLILTDNLPSFFLRRLHCEFSQHSIYFFSLSLNAPRLIVKRPFNRLLLQGRLVQGDYIFLRDLWRCGGLEKFIQRLLDLIIFPSFVWCLDATLSNVDIFVDFVRFFLEDVYPSALEDVSNCDISNIGSEDFLHFGEIDSAFLFEPELTFIFELAGPSNPRVLLFRFVKVMIGVDLHLDSVGRILGKLLLFASIVPALDIPCPLIFICLSVPHHLDTLIAIGLVLAYIFD